MGDPSGLLLPLVMGRSLATVVLGGAGNPAISLFCERTRKDQITSVLASPSTFFFCFSITASSSDTFSLSWRAG